MGPTLQSLLDIPPPSFPRPSAADCSLSARAVRQLHAFTAALNRFEQKVVPEMLAVGLLEETCAAIDAVQRTCAPYRKSLEDIALGKSIAQSARDNEVSPTTVSHWLKGGMPPALARRLPENIGKRGKLRIPRGESESFASFVASMSALHPGGHIFCFPLEITTTRRDRVSRLIPLAESLLPEVFSWSVRTNGVTALYFGTKELPAHLTSCLRGNTSVAWTHAVTPAERKAYARTILDISASFVNDSPSPGYIRIDREEPRLILEWARLFSLLGVYPTVHVNTTSASLVFQDQAELMALQARVGFSSDDDTARLALLIRARDASTRAHWATPSRVVRRAKLLNQIAEGINPDVVGICARKLELSPAVSYQAGLKPDHELKELWADLRLPTKVAGMSLEWGGEAKAASEFAAIAIGIPEISAVNVTELLHGDIVAEKKIEEQLNEEGTEDVLLRRSLIEGLPERELTRLFAILSENAVEDTEADLRRFLVAVKGLDGHQARRLSRVLLDDRAFSLEHIQHRVLSLDKMPHGQLQGEVIRGMSFLRKLERRIVNIPVIRQVFDPNNHGEPAISRDQRTLLDVGAWDGSLSCVAADLFGNLYGMEPDQRRFTQLLQAYESLAKGGTPAGVVKAVALEAAAEALVDSAQLSAKLPPVLHGILLSHVLSFLQFGCQDELVLRSLTERMGADSTMLIFLNDIQSTPGSRAHLRKTLAGKESDPNPHRYVDFLGKLCDEVKFYRVTSRYLFSGDKSEVVLRDVANLMLPGVARQRQGSLTTYLRRFCFDSEAPGVHALSHSYLIITARGGPAAERQFQPDFRPAKSRPSRAS